MRLSPCLRAAVVSSLVVACFTTCATAKASLDDCVEATARITAADGSTGTGCVFLREQGKLYLLTNAHVAGTSVGDYVDVEFWKEGFPSQKILGRNVWVSYHESASRDIAIVEVEESALGGVLPGIVPIAADGSPQQYETITSVGCANGAWPTAWHGHVEARVDELGSVVHFQPPPAGGRSGSAIFDAAGEKIIGLIAWRAADDSHGIAMTLDELHAALRGEPPAAIGHQRSAISKRVRLGEWIGGSRRLRRGGTGLATTECGPFGCFPRGGGGGQAPGGGAPRGGGYSPWNGGGGAEIGRAHV